MTELELTETMDQAFLIGEDHATVIANEILNGADASTYLMFARYCRNFIVNEDKYDIKDATPDTRQSLADAFLRVIALMETLVDFDSDEVRNFNNIIGNLKIDL